MVFLQLLSFQSDSVCLQSSSFYAVKEIYQCQYLSTNVINVDTKWNFWKKAAARTNIFVKSVEVQICKNCFLVSPLDRAANLRHGAMNPVQRGPVLFHKRKDVL